MWVWTCVRESESESESEREKRERERGLRHTRRTRDIDHMVRLNVWSVKKARCACGHSTLGEMEARSLAHTILQVARDVRELPSFYAHVRIWFFALLLLMTRDVVPTTCRVSDRNWFEENARARGRGRGREGERGRGRGGRERGRGEEG